MGLEGKEKKNKKEITNEMIVWKTRRKRKGGMDKHTRILPLVTHGLVICYYYKDEEGVGTVEAMDAVTGILKWAIEFPASRRNNIDLVVCMCCLCCVVLCFCFVSYVVFCVM